MSEFEVNAGELTRLETLDRRDRPIVEEIAASMEQHGWQGPPIVIVASEGKMYVLDGHHRVAAARMVSLKVRARGVALVDLPAFGYAGLDEVVSTAAARKPDALWAK